MFDSDLLDRGYEAGTFKIGQTVYFVKKVTHRFSFHKKCEYCDSTGKVLIKDREFTCPNCNGAIEIKEVIEKVVDEPNKIKSIWSFKNRNKSLETYTNESSGYGYIICKQKDGENLYFGSYEEAQSVCDEHNSKNNVYLLIDKYKQREIEEGFCYSEDDFDY